MFLPRLYREWKLLFWAVMIFVMCQLFSMYKGIENAPFFLYHMFGFAHPVKDSTPVLLIKTPKGYINPYQSSNRTAEMLLNNAAYYTYLQQNNYRDFIDESVERRFRGRLPEKTFQCIKSGLVNDSNRVKTYPDWWKRYFISVYGSGYDSVSLVTSYVRYSPTFSKSPVDSVVFTVHFK